MAGPFARSCIAPAVGGQGGSLRIKSIDVRRIRAKVRNQEISPVWIKKGTVGMGCLLALGVNPTSLFQLN